MLDNELTVLLGGTPAGTIRTPHPGADPVFEYEAGYIESNATPVSVRAPLTARPVPWRVLGPYLAGLLPENPDTRKLWAEKLHVEQNDMLGMLNEFGWDLPGAIQMTTPGRLEDMLDRSGSLRLQSEQDIADRIRAIRHQEASWTRSDEHWSLAGQQSKFALARGSDGRWYAAEGSAPTTHIFKPGIGQLHHQAMVEHITMRAADRIGLDVADSKLIDFGDQRAIVIQRFDRSRSADGTVRRIHQEDMAQATGTWPTKKYEVDGGPSLTKMAQVLRAHARTEDVDTELRLLADFAIINYVGGAPDGHSKNLSLQLAGDEVTVAPMYDLATEFPYDLKQPDGHRAVAVSVGGRRKHGQVLGRHWDRAARDIGLDPEWMRARVRQIATDYPDTFADELGGLDDAESESVLMRALPRLRKHAQQVLSRLDDAQEAPPSRRHARRPQPRGRTTPKTTGGSFRSYDLNESPPTNLL